MAENSKIFQLPIFSVLLFSFALMHLNWIWSQRKWLSF